MNIPLLSLAWGFSIALISASCLWVWTALAFSAELATYIVAVFGIPLYIVSTIVCLVEVLILIDCVRFNRDRKLKKNDW